ncbi:MAG: diguanylate cyclase, partial [Deltaproteobacteria bacterium]|nr:diguanylate cyclase [Deltaproteobacteria bacterium]
FAVILPETEAKQAAVLAERLKKTVKNYTVDAGGSLCNITLSMGVADISASTGSEDDLISRADRVLYMSKENGGDSVEVLCNA